MSRWAAHLVLVAVIVLELVGARVLHRDAEALHAAAATGSTAERIAALHVLANRDDPTESGIDVDACRDLLDGDDPLVADFAHTIDLSRLGSTEVMEGERRVFRMPTEPDELRRWWMRFVLYRRKVGDMAVGAVRRLVIVEIEWFYAARAGADLERDDIRRHMDERRRIGRIDRGVLPGR